MNKVTEKSRKENVSDALLDCGGWAEQKRERIKDKERHRRSRKTQREKKRGAFYLCL